MMMTTPVHIPVLLNEVLEALPLPPAARILDLTLGLGGHAEALLRRCDGDSRYAGVDRDPEARALAQERLGHDPRLAVFASAHEEVFRQPDFQAWKALHAPRVSMRSSPILASRPSSSSPLPGASASGNRAPWTCGWIPTPA